MPFSRVFNHPTRVQSVAVLRYVQYIHQQTYRVPKKQCQRRDQTSELLCDASGIDVALVPRAKRPYIRLSLHPIVQKVIFTTKAECKLG